MHQPSLVVDTLLQGYHGLCPADTVDIINLEDDVFRMRGIPSPDLAEDIELARGDMGHGNVGYLAQSLQNELGLVRFLQKYPDISYKGIAQFNIIKC